MFSIVFITNSISFGGAEKMLCFIASELAKRGHRISIINRNTMTNSSTYERSMPENVSYNLLNAEKKWQQVMAIKKIAKKVNADIIIGFTNYPNFMAKIAGKMLHIPSIMSERGDPSRTISHSWQGKFILSVINRSSGGVFQTDGAMKFYGKCLQKRGIVIPNPIFIDGEVPVVDYEKSEKSVVSVGRFDNTQKRYDIMLNAFKLFSDRHPEYILKLYGSGPDEELVRKIVHDLNLNDKVRFMGLTTKPMQDIADSGMFLITSDYEGISNSLLEAMAVGLPCVSTDHTPGGARLLIQDHENGLLAPIGDYERLADAMCEFADNPQLAKKCGKNAKDVVNRFAPERIIDMWESYIKSVVE